MHLHFFICTHENMVKSTHKCDSCVWHLGLPDGINPTGLSSYFALVQLSSQNEICPVFSPSSSQNEICQ